jgi:hypothetical protein
MGDTYSKQNGRFVKGWRGSEAGKEAEYDERQDQRRRQEYDNEQGWGGLGGASRKPKGDQYEEGYQAWLQKKYPAKPKPKPTSTPTPKPPVSSDEAADELEKRKP